MSGYCVTCAEFVPRMDRHTKNHEVYPSKRVRRGEDNMCVEHMLSITVTNLPKIKSTQSESEDGFRRSTTIEASMGIVELRACKFCAYAETRYYAYVFVNGQISGRREIPLVE